MGVFANVQTGNVILIAVDPPAPVPSRAGRGTCMGSESRPSAVLFIVDERLLR